MTDQQLTAYYQNLLIIQYADKPNALATIAALTAPLITNQIVQAVFDGFNLETAVGAQLDLIGTYKGVSRDIFGLNLTRHYMSFPYAADANPGSFYGMATAVEGPIPTVYFLRAQDINNVEYAMNDSEYRSVLELLSAIQNAKYTNGAIDEILFEFFGTNVNMVEDGPRHITYHDSPSDANPLFSICSQLNLLPRPAGVAVSYSVP